MLCTIENKFNSVRPKYDTLVYYFSCLQFDPTCLLCKNLFLISKVVKKMQSSFICEAVYQGKWTRLARWWMHSCCAFLQNDKLSYLQSVTKCRSWSCPLNLFHFSVHKLNVSGLQLRVRDNEITECIIISSSIAKRTEAVFHLCSEWCSIYLALNS